jgi:transposase
MLETTAFVGLDTDKAGIDIAVAEGEIGGEVRYLGRIAATAAGLSKAIKKVQERHPRLAIVYEAGPCGYGIYRRLNAMPGVVCQVAAPSLIPRRAGVRVKTNRRDAIALAKLHRAGELTAIWVPDAAHEAMRDLVRARGQAMADLTRHRQRIAGFLLRQEVGYVGKPWTKAHRLYLTGLTFAFPAQQRMWTELLTALDQAKARRERLDQLIGEQIPSWSLAWLVEALIVLRGFQRLSAAIVAAEIGDPRRFSSPTQLMGFLGLTASEDSTGEKRRQGGLTKTGNSRARKTLIEAAWTYARAAKPSEHQAAGQPALVAIADKARHRLSLRYRSLRIAGKRQTVAIAAVARELAGFVWAAAHAAGPKVADKTAA